MTCPFCEIVAGRAQASVAYDDERIVAFADLRPVNPGHLLVVPRVHVARLSQLDREVGRCLWDAAVRLAAATVAVHGDKTGVNLVLSDGDAAGQDVPHVHVHVIPRHRGDGYRIDADAWHSDPPSRQDLDAAMTVIRSVLSN